MVQVMNRAHLSGTILAEPPNWGAVQFVVPPSGGLLFLHRIGSLKAELQTVVPTGCAPFTARLKLARGKLELKIAIQKAPLPRPTGMLIRAKER